MPTLRSLPSRIFSFLKRRWLLVVIVVVVLVGIGVWQVRARQSAGKDLNFVSPEYRDLTKTLEVSGIIDAKEKANLRFIAGGKVIYLGAKEGQPVKKGQLIAQLDQRELQKRLQQDLNAYMRERWDFETTQDATDYHVEDLVTRRELDKEQWNLEDTVLDIEVRDIAISNTRLHAPFAGVLVESPLSTAGVTLLGSDVFEIINPSTLIFIAAVDEADVSQVSFGQIGDISLDAYPDAPITASVSAIAYKSQQSTTGTVFLIEMPISLNDVDGSALLNRYRLGMNGEVVLELEKKSQVLSIPIDATRQRDGKTYVDVKTSDTTTEEREIQVGLETDEWLEVTGGLSQDEQILLPES